MLNESGGWKRTLTWKDALAFQYPGLTGVFVGSGFALGTLGAWGMVLVYGIMGTVGLLLALSFCEMATMFPAQTGGTSMFLRMGLRRYCIPLGVIGAFGYMLSWALSIGFNGMFVGTLIQMQWFPKTTWGVDFILGVRLGPGHFIAIALVVVAWLTSLLGVHLTARISYVVGVLMIVMTVLVVVGPIAAGKLHASNMSLHMPGWAAFTVWLYLAGYTMFIGEMPALFTPEYKRPSHDAPRAVLSVSLLMMGATMLVGAMCTSTIGEKGVLDNPLNYGVVAAQTAYGSWIGPVITIIICASMAVFNITFMNDATRALAGMAEGGLSITQLTRKNRRGSPTWAAHVVLIANIIVLLLVSNTLTLILAANLGYVLACMLAGWSFVILRRTEPDLPRPFKLSGPVWVPLMVAVNVFVTFAFIMGVTHPDLAGYGGARETIVAIVLILVGLIFWVVRVVAQDHQSLHWRDTAKLSSSPMPLGAETGPGEVPRA
jgi:amino acid transporter